MLKPMSYQELLDKAKTYLAEGETTGDYWLQDRGKRLVKYAKAKLKESLKTS